MTDMTKQEALNILIAVACCSTPELTCEDCPRYTDNGDDEIAAFPSDGTCDGWNEHELADAVKVMREVRFDGEDTAGASPRPTRGEVSDA